MIKSKALSTVQVWRICCLFMKTACIRGMLCCIAGLGRHYAIMLLVWCCLPLAQGELPKNLPDGLQQLWLQFCCQAGLVAAVLE